MSQHTYNNHTWDPNHINHININHHLSAIVSTATIEVENGDNGISLDDEKLRTELDSHVNMTMIGRHIIITNNMGWVAEVGPFTPEYEALCQLKIVDAEILYVCSYNDHMYMLIVRNPLSVMPMRQNLVPVFIL